eukprot:CAMPEP_0195636382 /NCGR_PEP_ID=MMETSP0815-20121206/23828_1 /TAXON_ID=97485 /ORGANISM="Prymnesium parvum, Strain Texoma1" /LENGTH=110 /DNA_ID=CAMNT_0040778465 /DNA_START=206 /DNA_END=535 /DNA_ORIENTATION=-
MTRTQRERCAGCARSFGPRDARGKAGLEGQDPKRLANDLLAIWNKGSSIPHHCTPLQEQAKQEDQPAIEERIACERHYNGQDHRSKIHEDRDTPPRCHDPTALLFGPHHE